VLPMMNRNARSLPLAFLTSVILVGAALAQGTITVTSSSDYAVVGLTKQFTATISGLTDNQVAWYAGGIAGGNATVGTISSAGLYTAPARPPAQNPVQITARSLADASVSGSMYVNVLTTGPTITSVSPNPIPVGTVTVTIAGSGFQSGATV